MKHTRKTGARKNVQGMASISDRELQECLYMKCPFPDITGCDYLMIVRGYCTVGKYCVQDCEYAWMPHRDDA